MAQHRQRTPPSTSSGKQNKAPCRCTTNIFLFIAAIFCSRNVVDASYSMVVPSGEEECFVIRAPSKEKSFISGNYDILDDELSADPISVVLYNSNRNDVWHSVPGSSEGTFSISGKGIHELCISNGLGGSGPGGRGRKAIQRADGNERTVGFAVRVKAPKRAKVGDNSSEEGPEDERTSNLISMSDTLLEGFYTMQDHQEYLKDREAKHQLLTTQTYGRIMRWTCLEALVLCFIAGGQVMYLKKFFEKKTYL